MLTTYDTPAVCRHSAQPVAFKRSTDIVRNHLDDEVDITGHFVPCNRRVRPHDELPVPPTRNEKVLAHWQPQLVLRARQREAEAAGVSGEYLFLGEGHRQLLSRIEGHLHFLLDHLLLVGKT